MPRIFCLATVVLVLALTGPSALAGEPPVAPFPRIEVGQHTAPINRIGVDAAGRWLVTASDDKTARVWDLQTGELLRVLRPPIGESNEGKLYAAALSPDGRTVAVGGWTGYAWDGQHSIYLFDRATGELTHRISDSPLLICLSRTRITAPRRAARRDCWLLGTPPAPPVQAAACRAMPRGERRRAAGDAQRPQGRVQRCAPENAF